MKTALIAILPLLIACSAPASHAQETHHNKEFQRTLSISGEGKASAAPDLAVLNFGVQTQGDTAGAAIAANAAKMNKVNQALKAMGIAARDLQTSNFSLNPMYARDNRGRTENNLIIGYQTSNTLTVRLRNIDKVGSAIDKTVAAGANNFHGLSFGFQNADKMMDEARRNAVRNARAIAELMAEEAGVELGSVLTMSESSYHPSPQPMARMEMAADSFSSTPIEAGESQLTVNVNIVFGLK